GYGRGSRLVAHRPLEEDDGPVGLADVEGIEPGGTRVVTDREDRVIVRVDPDPVPLVEPPRGGVGDDIGGPIPHPEGRGSDLEVGGRVTDGEEGTVDVDVAGTVPAGELEGVNVGPRVGPGHDHVVGIRPDDDDVRVDPDPTHSQPLLAWGR